MAYVSTESGRPEVYVTSFPGPGGKWQVSTGGGAWPRWRDDGQEIFYVAPNNRLMVAAVNGQSADFRVAGVTPLFDTRPRPPQFVRGAPPPYDVSADGQRFLVNTLAQDAAATPITLVVNWPALLKKP
jgi:eukaryotic-like serine/threonine-protein kinase